ncbi:hypothetical protein JHK87_007877 [Glycine soja]|nr:hypothetical protein JHK87_007877 [Glycine soja]
MATYFHHGNSEIQSGGADGLQTLVLMNPGYIHYSDAPPPQQQTSQTAGNLVFLNPAAVAGGNNNSFNPHAPPSHTQQFVGIPLPNSQDLNHHSMHAHHDVSALHGFLPRMQYNPWNALDPALAARENPRAQQGLSLGLGSFREGQAPAMSGDDLRISGGSPSSASGVTNNGASGIQSVLLSSKYLKAAHELLEEVVNVNNGIGTELGKKRGGQNKVVGESSAAARTYTALALQTISKQFRCLKDAIAGQHNAWRPQRGLPERSVSVLRAWLFEHFLHPYPKDSDKHMLAKQTGLTRSQVSNWFINARVRLWKPMVEEMYTEEMKDHEQNRSEDKSSKSNEDSASKMSAPQDKGPSNETEAKSFNSKHEVSKSQNTAMVSVSRPSTSPLGVNVRSQSGFSFMGSSELDGITQGSPKKPRNHEMMHSPNSVPSMSMDVKPNDENNEQLSMKFGVERQGRNESSFMGNQTNFNGGFGQYPIGDIGRFDTEQFTPRLSGNGVSLTLGLDSLPGTHQTFLPNQNIQLGRSLDIGEPNEFGEFLGSSCC